MELPNFPRVLALQNYIEVELVQEGGGSEFGAWEFGKWTEIDAENRAGSITDCNEAKSTDDEVVILTGGNSHLNKSKSTFNAVSLPFDSSVKASNRQCPYKNGLAGPETSRLMYDPSFDSFLPQHDSAEYSMQQVGYNSFLIDPFNRPDCSGDSFMHKGQQSRS